MAKPKKTEGATMLSTFVEGAKENIVTGLNQAIKGKVVEAERALFRVAFGLLTLAIGLVFLAIAIVFLLRDAFHGSFFLGFLGVSVGAFVLCLITYREITRTS